MRVGDGLPQVGHRRVGVLGRDAAGLDPLLEQGDLAGQLVELAAEVGQCLRRLGAGVGADRALAVGGAHEDGAVLGDPSPGGGVRGGAGLRRGLGGRGRGAAAAGVGVACGLGGTSSAGVGTGVVALGIGDRRGLGDRRARDRLGRPVQARDGCRFRRPVRLRVPVRLRDRLGESTGAAGSAGCSSGGGAAVGFSLTSGLPDRHGSMVTGCAGFAVAARRPSSTPASATFCTTSSPLVIVPKIV